MKKTREAGLRKSVPDCGNGLHGGVEMIPGKRVGTIVMIVLRGAGG